MVLYKKRTNLRQVEANVYELRFCLAIPAAADTRYFVDDPPTMLWRSSNQKEAIGIWGTAVILAAAHGDDWSLNRMTVRRVYDDVLRPMKQSTPGLTM